MRRKYNIDYKIPEEVEKIFNRTNWSKEKRKEQTDNLVELMEAYISFYPSNGTYETLELNVSFEPSKIGGYLISVRPNEQIGITNGFYDKPELISAGDNIIELCSPNGEDYYKIFLTPRKEENFQGEKNDIERKNH